MSSRFGVFLLLGTVLGLLAVSLFFRHETQAARAAIDAKGSEWAQTAKELQAKATELSSSAPAPSVEKMRAVVGSYPEKHGASVHWKPLAINVPVMSAPAAPRVEALHVQVGNLETEVAKRSKEFEATTEQADATVNVLAVRKQIIAGILSGAVLCFSLYAIFSQKHRKDADKWAFGSIGTILGYWLSNG